MKNSAKHTKVASGDASNVATLKNASLQHANSQRSVHASTRVERARILRHRRLRIRMRTRVFEHRNHRA
jgi:hypothetical protein